jgi:thioredoxin-related protein
MSRNTVLWIAAAAGVYWVASGGLNKKPPDKEPARPIPAPPSDPTPRPKPGPRVVKSILVVSQDNCGACQRLKKDWPKSGMPPATWQNNSQDLTVRYRIEFVPTIIALDDGGQEVKRHVGYMAPAELQRWVKGETTDPDQPPPLMPPAIDEDAKPAPAAPQRKLLILVRDSCNWSVRLRADWRQGYGVPHEYVTLSPEEAKKWGTSSTPTLILLGPDGKELRRHEGYTKADSLRTWLEGR